MRATYVPVDKNGKFLHPIFIWQDQRGEEMFPWMKERLDKFGMTTDELYDITGFPFGFSVPQYSKVYWFKKHYPDLYEKTYKMVSPQALLTHAFGATDDWLDDDTDANWWQICDADTFKYVPKLAEVFDVDIDKYPTNLRPSTPLGKISKEVAAKTGLKEGTPFFMGSGDQQCGAIGVGNSGEKGLGSVCLGTAGLALGYSPVPVRDKNRRAHILGHPGTDGYTMECHASAAASSFRWLRNTIGQFEMTTADLTKLDIYDLLTAQASQSPIGAKGTVFLPWLAGAACPHYDDNARGSFIGMTLGTTKGDLLRAAMEGICFEMREMLATLNNAGFAKFERLRVTGGAARSSLWNEIQANIYGTAVETVEVAEATALGAAMLGAIGAGIYKDLKEATENMVHMEGRWEPDPAKVEQYNEVYDIFLASYLGLKEQAFPKIFKFQNK